MGSKILAVTALTRTKLEALLRRPPERRVDIADGLTPGLVLRATPFGTMTWSLQFRIAGAGGVTARGHKVKGQPRFRLTIGRYPAVSLADARATAAKYRAMADRGENPQTKLEQQATVGTGTVAAIAREYFDTYVRPATLRSEEKIRYAIETHIVPEWGNRAAASLSRREVVLFLERLLQKRKIGGGRFVGGPEAARSVKNVLHRMFEWACKRDILGANPVTGVADPAKSVSRDRVLTMEEVRAVWRACETLKYPFGPLYRLLLLTGCRRGEWANARWSWIDVLTGEMHIPPEAYKSRRTHIVPLSTAAIETINTLVRWNGGDHIFSGTNGRNPLSGFSHGKERLARAIEAQLGRPLANWRPHDFRRSVATHLRRLGVDRHVVKRVLGHAENDVTAVYDRYGLLDEARAALELWSKTLAPSITATEPHEEFLRRNSIAA